MKEYQKKKQPCAVEYIWAPSVCAAQSSLLSASQSKGHLPALSWRCHSIQATAKTSQAYQSFKHKLSATVQIPAPAEIKQEHSREVPAKDQQRMSICSEAPSWWSRPETSPQLITVTALCVPAHHCCATG